MRCVVVEAEFARARQRFNLRFCCEDCTFFLPEEERCIHFWPTEDHRAARYERDDFGAVVFCKEFELK